jgi:hypothetical protein
LIRRLRLCTGEKRRQQRRVRVEQIHRRQAKQTLHRMNDADRRVEVVVDKRLRQVRRIFTDYQGGGSMGIDVIGAILRVIFENEDGGVVPVGTVGNGIDHPAEACGVGLLGRVPPVWSSGR